MVPSSQRKESTLDFLKYARDLQAYTIRKCVNAVPKRYTFYIGTHLSDSATRVYEYLKKGNSIYPLNKHEAQLRRDYMLKAYAELNSLVSQVELANEIIEFEDAVMDQWSEKIYHEMTLVKKVISADRERYKNLPET